MIEEILPKEVNILKEVGVKIEVPYSFEKKVFAESNGAIERLQSCEASILLAEMGCEDLEPSTMHVTIFNLDNGACVVVCDELAENKGRSVTNSWPKLADYLCSTFELPREIGLCHFVERYGDFSYKGGRLAETMDKVLIYWDQGSASLSGWARLKYGSKVTGKLFE